MNILQIMAYLAAVTIIAASLWACLSLTVRDRMPLKISLGLTTLSAYLVLVHTSERTLTMLAVSTGAVIIAAGYQRFVQRSRLFYRARDRNAHAA